MKSTHGLTHSRRWFLGAGAAGAGGAWLALHAPVFRAAALQAREAAASGSPLASLTSHEFTELEAIAARIIPETDTPGAREAGIGRFIDQAFASFRAPDLPAARRGLSELQALVAAAGSAGEPAGADTTDPGGNNAPLFSELSQQRQDDLLSRIEGSEFFELVRWLTVVGTFALPSYGGNQDQIGWRILGFDDRHTWVPPFGAYDGETEGG